MAPDLCGRRQIVYNVLAHNHISLCYFAVLTTFWQHPDPNLAPVQQLFEDLEAVLGMPGQPSSVKCKAVQYQ